MIFRKKSTLYTVLMIMLIFVVSACSSDDSEDTNTEETIKLKYNIAYGPVAYDFNSPKALATEEFKRRVEEETDGRVEVELFFNSQLTPADEMMEALSGGVLDMGTYNPHVFGDTLPTGHAMSLPFWANDEENALELLNSEYGQIHEQEVEEYGVKPLFHWLGGEQGMMSNNPIKSIDDFEGQLFRIESGYWKPWYEDLGMAPVKVDPVDIYSGLQRGTVDGVFFSSYTLDSLNFHEVVDYMTVPGIVDPVIQTVWMGLDVWNEIPSDLQDIITSVSDELESETVEASKKMNEIAIDTAEGHGVELNEINEEELERFKESTQVIWDGVESINEDTARMIEILRENQN